MALRGNNLDEANRIINVLRADLDRVYLAKNWLLTIIVVLLVALAVAIKY